jgi:hypothetical protein
MRSDLVFGALKHVPNRFLLTKLAAKAIRELHRPNTRISETANDVLARFSRSNPMAAGSHSSKQPAIRIDLIRSVSRMSQPGSKVNRATTTQPDQLAETA